LQDVLFSSTLKSDIIVAYVCAVLACGMCLYVPSLGRNEFFFVEALRTQLEVASTAAPIHCWCFYCCISLARTSRNNARKEPDICTNSTKINLVVWQNFRYLRISSCSFNNWRQYSRNAASGCECTFFNDHRS
jgi:hypothetical protein